jgi:hypothetical protein
MTWFAGDLSRKAGHRGHMSALADDRNQVEVSAPHSKRFHSFLTLGGIDSAGNGFSTVRGVLSP